MQKPEQKLKELARALVPPIAWNLGSRFRASLLPEQTKQHGMFEGPISSWDEAVARSDGWDASAITAKTLEVALKVKNGEIEYEQDTQIQKKIIYSPTILAFLLLALSRNKSRLQVVDFGGSLATNWFQNRKLLRALRGTAVQWCVVEREVLVELGKKHFAGDGLGFASNLEDAVRLFPGTPESFLFSGSLQYLAQPFDTVDQAIALGAKVLAFDRLLVSPVEKDSANVQHPDPEKHYQATYPVWCFSRDGFVSHLGTRGFSLVEHFTANPDKHFDHCGMLFVRDA